MKKILPCLYFLGFFLLSTNFSHAQCTGGTFTGSILPSAVFQTIACVQGGQYYTFPAVAGNQYTFTFCSNGGAASYDTQLTILDNTGAFAGGYNDDNCGLQSEVLWSAPSTGTFRVLINQYNCATNATCGTLAYREAGPAGPGANCVTPFVVPALPFSNTGMTTCGYGDDFSSTDACGSLYMNGDDFVFSYTAASPQTIRIDLTNTGTYVGVFVTDDCPNAVGANCIAASTGSVSSCTGGAATNTSSAGNPTADFTLPAAGTYYITVSTFPSPQCTAFDIDITNVTTTAPSAGLGCYSISNPAYAPDAYTTGTILTFPDDEFSSTTSIGFPFCFMGTFYSDVVVSSNAYITFNTTCATAYSPWNTETIPPSASPEVHNAILGPWSDINPNTGGNIRYRLLGTAPNRRLVVNYDRIPMFSCTSDIFTGQITIYETTNIIETYIESYIPCPGWNNGEGVLGLVDATGTVAVPVPGYNNTTFTLSNYAVRYTPTCAPCATILTADISVFDGLKTDAGNLLRWATHYEWNSESFVIERSGDGSYFEAIGTVDGVGTEPKGSEYNFVDEKAAGGTQFYRLKMIDTDGNESYSEIIAIEGENAGIALTNAYQNEQSIVVDVFASAQNQPVQARLVDGLGRVLAEQPFTLQAGKQSLQLATAGIPAGYYMIVLTDGNSFRQTRKIILR